MANVRIQLAALVESRLDKSSGCWLWTGGNTEINGHAYGRFSAGGTRFYVHRLAYRIWVGPIQDGATVTQTCGFTLCCNPDHLRSGYSSA